MFISYYFHLYLISYLINVYSWYDTKYIKTFATGVIGGTSWKGILVGVAENDSAPQNSAISLKLEKVDRMTGSSDLIVPLKPMLMFKKLQVRLQDFICCLCKIHRYQHLLLTSFIDR